MPEGLVHADLAVEDGVIAHIGSELPAGVGASDGVEIDARDMDVLPGLIDVHVHFNEPGRAEWEGAVTGSRALAAGGGTLFFDMPLNSSPCTVDGASFDAKRAALERASVTDFALWGGLIPGNRDALAELAERGVIGFKAFMADSGLPEFPRADDQTLLDGMREAARLGLPVAVHAESDEMVAALAARARAAGKTGIRDYLDSRPVAAEVEAIERACRMAGETGAKLHIVHISSGRGARAAAEARARGVDVTLESCPHYLFFTEDDMLRLGAVAKCAPPLRAARDRDELRAAVHRGDIDMVGSDHSPAPPAMKQDRDFFGVWGGVAGIGSTLAVLLGETTMERAAALTAGNPARRFGIAGKGALRVGYDADFVVVDAAAESTVRAEDLLQRHRFSPYIGATFRGVVRRTVLRGRTIFADGKMVAGAGGRMVKPGQRTEYAESRIHA
jgi:allantoinase